MHPPDPAPVAARSADGSAGPSREFLRRYGRQIILPEIGLEGQQRLARARVLVVGLGGLGASAALHLAAAGVGELTLWDPDVVELSNLHRQVLYTVGDLGRPKVAAAEARIVERNPLVRVRGRAAAFERDGALDEVRAVDVVVDATDNFPARYRISDAAVRAGRPVVFAAVAGLEGQWAVFDAARGPCYRCLFPEPPPPESRPTCGEAGVLGVVPALLGSLQAAEVLRLLLGWRSDGSTEVHLLDLPSMEVRAVRLKKRPDCPGCGPGAAERPMPEEPPARRTAIPADGFAFVSAEALRSELNGPAPPTVLDVREAAERALGAVPGAWLVPFAELPSRLGELAAAVRPVVVCQFGGRSEQAGRLLAEAGLRDVRVLRGGWDAYLALPA